MTVGQRIKQRRKELGISVDELAEKLKKNRATIYRYENEEIGDLPATILEPLAVALHTTPAELLGWSADSTYDKTGNNLSRIPILGRVVAGVPIEAIEEVLGYVDLDDRLSKRGDYFALQVKGDSMTPTLHDGDTIIVRKQEDINSGELGIVLVNGDEATVKEVKKSEAGITLIGHNASVYPPHFYSREEVESLPVQIIGKVVKMERWF